MSRTNAVWRLRGRLARERVGLYQTADDLVLQERAGEAVLLAVAFDVTVVGRTPRAS